MNYIRFYQEFEDSRKKRPTGNVIAVMTDKKGFPEMWFQGNEPMVSAITAVFDKPNSEVAGSNVSRGYLRSKSKRISEDKARKIHPRLFYYLGMSDKMNR